MACDSELGKWSDTKDANEEIQKISDRIKPEVEKKTSKDYKEFTAIKFRDQLVNGTNYLIKVHVGQYLHLKVYSDLQGKLTLVSVEQHHGKDDPLVP